MKLCMWHHYDAVLDSNTGKITTWAIHSGSGHSTGIQYRMHVNTPIETWWRRKFSSVRTQNQYTVQDACERYFNLHVKLSTVARQKGSNQSTNLAENQPFSYPIQQSELHPSVKIHSLFSQRCVLMHMINSLISGNQYFYIFKASKFLSVYKYFK